MGSPMKKHRSSILGTTTSTELIKQQPDLLLAAPDELARLEPMIFGANGHVVLSTSTDDDEDLEL